MSVRSEKMPSPMLVAVHWMIVLVPLGWGVVQSVVKSLPLFRMASIASLGSAPGP